MPVDYVELLGAIGYPLFLASAYDIAQCIGDQRSRMNATLKRSQERGSVILMDSGNYEGFWKGDAGWQPDKFHEIVSTSHYHLCFCYDNQEPPRNSESIAKDVVASILRDQEHAIGTVAPIVHGATELLPDAIRIVTEQLCPMLLAVPERALGEGIVERIRTVKKIRKSLNTLGAYFPLHLLGTGNPLSIIAYAMAGADSFDGLEWCQIVVDHKTGRLFHFQQWDLFHHQTEWGQSQTLPYIQSVLMHNLNFYKRFMADLHEAVNNDVIEPFLRRYTTNDQATLLLHVLEEDEET